MKFLIDESSGRKLFSFLLSREYDVRFVSDTMPGALDRDVLAFAEKEGRILITNDKDFGELIFRLKMLSHGVILLRLKDERTRNKIYYLNYLITNYSDRLENHFTIIKEGKIRIRKL